MISMLHVTSHVSTGLRLMRAASTGMLLLLMMMMMMTVISDKAQTPLLRFVVDLLCNG